MNKLRRLVVGTALLAGLLVVTALASPARLERLFDRTKTVRVAVALSQPVRQTITFGGRQRTYWLYRPANATAKPPLQVVLYARGFPPPGMGAYTSVSDREGVVLVFPVTESEWRDPSDHAFVGDVIDAAVAGQNLDGSRVYVTGGSGSAFQAFRIACGPVGKRFAGVGSLFGGIITNSAAPDGIAQACQPPRPMSIIEVHGTRDPFVPYDGRPCQISDSGRYVCLPSQAKLMAFWASANGCDPTPATTASGKLRIDLWQTCRNGTAVELATVIRGGHSPESLTVGGVTPQARIWDFFKAHPGSQQTTQLRTELLSVRVTRTKGQRHVVVRLSVNEAATVRISLVLSAKTIAAATFRPREGSPTLRLAVPGRAKAGRYLLRVLVQAGGESRLLTRTISVRA